MSFLIVLRSVFTPTVIMLFALKLVELKGVSPSNVNLSVLSISFVLMVILCNRFGSTTNGSGGFMVSPTKMIFVSSILFNKGLRKCELPYKDTSLTISSPVREVNEKERSTMPI